MVYILLTIKLCHTVDQKKKCLKTAHGLVWQAGIFNKLSRTILANGHLVFSMKRSCTCKSTLKDPIQHNILDSILQHYAEVVC